MTPDLISRVATAMAAADGNTWSSPDALMAVYGDLARAAVGVVVEACAEVCMRSDINAHDDCGEEIAKAIRAIAGQQPREEGT